MKVIHGNVNSVKKSDSEIDKLRTDLTSLGLTEKTIDAQLHRFTRTSQDAAVPILEIIKHEFDFFLLHVFDLFDELSFDWSGLDIKLAYINPSNIDKEHLVYVIEGYRAFLTKQ